MCGRFLRINSIYGIVNGIRMMKEKLDNLIKIRNREGYILKVILGVCLFLFLQGTGNPKLCPDDKGESECTKWNWNLCL